MSVQFAEHRLVFAVLSIAVFAVVLLIPYDGHLAEFRGATNRVVQWLVDTVRKTAC